MNILFILNANSLHINEKNLIKKIYDELLHLIINNTLTNSYITSFIDIFVIKTHNKEEIPLPRNSIIPYTTWHIMITIN